MAARRKVARTDTSTKAKKVYKRKIKVVNPKVPRTRNMGTQTETEYFSKIRSALRSAFRFWKPMQAALELASRPSKSANKRIKKEYQCACCSKWFQRNKVEVDHIEECGSLTCLDDIAEFIRRLTKEDVSSYQILCKDECHKKKTKAYLEARKALRATKNLNE